MGGAQQERRLNIQQELNIYSDDLLVQVVLGFKIMKA